MDTESEWWETKSLLPFSAPTTILICGSTQSGKTYFTKRLLQNADGMFCTPVDKIIYAYSEFQPMFDEMMSDIPRLIFHQGLPSKEDIEQYTEGVNHTIVVLDDLMLQVAQSQDCVQLFTVTSHHRNVTTVMLSQNLYPPGKYARTISLNCLNVILFRNSRQEFSPDHHLRISDITWEYTIFQSSIRHSYTSKFWLFARLSRTYSK